jgi:hypothetical protein
MFLTIRAIARALLAAAAVTAVALTSQPAASAAASTASTGWSILPTPDPARTNISHLYAVSCSSAAACTAVGDYVSSSGAQVTLAERWNGATGTWAIELTPNPAAYNSSQLTAVSCPSSSTCIAVGSTDYGVRTLAERWNATTGTWTILPSGTGGEGWLQGVSCSSSAACTAVGSAAFNGALAERWNGVTWSVQQMTSPRDSGLSAVSCPASTDCTAVGSLGTGGGTFAEQWNGTTDTWTEQATVSPTGNSFLNGVSCSAPAACTAVGNYEINSSPWVTLAERWNGTNWVQQPTPSSTTGIAVALEGVSCPSPASCTAAGYYYPSPGQQTLAEHWNGTAWSIQPTPNPVGASSSQLNGVSCPPSAPCTAAGYYRTFAGSKTLTERS